jgi:glutamate synthase (NADPH/NADH) large chain
MTGGTVVVLGRTGRNFAAGMSGGRAFVLDLDLSLLNTEMVDAVAVPKSQRGYLQTLLSRFRDETNSEVAAALLKDWDATLLRLTMVMPRDYARVLAAMEKAIREGLPVDKYVMEVAHG